MLGKRARAGVKRGDRAVFTPLPPLKIFSFKNIFQDFCDRRWTTERVSQVASSVLTPFKRFCPFPNVPLHSQKTFFSYDTYLPMKPTPHKCDTRMYLLRMYCHHTECCQMYKIHLYKRANTFVLLQKILVDTFM